MRSCPADGIAIWLWIIMSADSRRCWLFARHRSYKAELGREWVAMVPIHVVCLLLF